MLQHLCLCEKIRPDSLLLIYAALSLACAFSTKVTFEFEIKTDFAKTVDFFSFKTKQENAAGRGNKHV